MLMRYDDGGWSAPRRCECQRCGIEFKSASRNAKYCPDCRVEKRKKNRKVR